MDDEAQKSVIISTGNMGMNVIFSNNLESNDMYSKVGNNFGSTGGSSSGN